MIDALMAFIIAIVAVFVIMELGLFICWLIGTAVWIVGRAIFDLFAKLSK